MNEYIFYKNKIISATKLSEKKKQYYLDVSKRLYDLGFPIILNSFHLSNLCGVKWNSIQKLIDDNITSYHKFFITKKNGYSKRKILAPNSDLSAVQKYIKVEILDKVKISDSCYGFVKKKNIVTNAKVHIGNEIVLNIDLKDFFPSISSDRVYYIFNKICGYDKTMSYCLTKLVTYRNFVPQGACTSPTISNIVSFMLDVRLEQLSKKCGINYTRYADDITFSGSSEKINFKFYNFVKKIIEEEGFVVNENKVHFSAKSNRQEVTGLIVNNNKISVSRTYIRKIKQELYYIGKFGLELHIKNSNIENGFYVEHLKGKIMFVRSIDYQKGNDLLKEFNKLGLDSY